MGSANNGVLVVGEELIWGWVGGGGRCWCCCCCCCCGGGGGDFTGLLGRVGVGTMPRVVIWL